MNTTNLTIIFPKHMRESQGLLRSATYSPWWALKAVNMLTEDFVNWAAMGN